MGIAWARFEGHGMVTGGDITDMKRQIRAWRKEARALAKLIREYDTAWHGAMWDGRCEDSREVSAWAKIMERAQAKGM
jgi:hypothetical protein